MKEDLKKLRDEIDSIDNEILRLIERRVEVVKEVGHLKGKNKGQIYVPSREEAIFKRLSEKSKLKKSRVRSIFTEIISSCREFEEYFTLLVLGEKEAILGREIFGNAINILKVNEIGIKKEVDFVLLNRKDCKNIEIAKTNNLVQYSNISYFNEEYILFGKKYDLDIEVTKVEL